MFKNRRLFVHSMNSFDLLVILRLFPDIPDYQFDMILSWLLHTNKPYIKIEHSTSYTLQPIKYGIC